MDRGEDAALRRRTAPGDGRRLRLRCHALRGARETAAEAQHLLRLRYRGKLRLSAERLPARQGRELGLPDVRGTLRLGERPRTYRPRIPRRDFSPLWLLPRGRDQYLLRRG